MNDRRHSADVSVTGKLLRELLVATPAYRRVWLEQVKRHRSDLLSSAAVARVIALHLWGSGERADTERSLPRDLKDRVRRALAGTSLTPETITWFTQAFNMTERDEHMLWATYAGSRDDQLEGISHTLVTQRSLLRRQRHRTLALFERYLIDHNGSLTERHTMHTIMAVEEGVDRYFFHHEPFVDRIDVIHGGQLGERHEYGGGLYGDDILLDSVMRMGETASLEYRTLYRADEYFPTEVRRPAHGRAENIDISLHFDSDRLPAAIWWAVWGDHTEGTPIREEAVMLNAHRMVRRFVPFIEETAVGFRWQW